MSPSVRFGVLCLPNVPWPTLRERVVRVEQLGFDFAGLADHFVDWTNPPTPWHESWTALTALAGATTRLRLASYVAQIPFRNPAFFARQALTLDHVSGGRVEVGLGTGLVGDPSYAMIGMPDWDAKERVARFGEYVEIIDRLLRDELTTYQGSFYRVTGAIMNPRPIQQPRPPIIVAALGPGMIRHAVARADVWSSLSFKASFEDQVEETRRRIEVVDEACARAGRAPDSLRRSYTMYDAQARPRGGAYDCYTSVERFEAMAGRVLELGIDEIVVYHPLDDRQRPVFERVATDVLPRLRPATSVA